ncbi:MAG TPA: hypothetical protein VFU64_00430 [Gaiellaceae bacterium]|nr:hypothetical protein [Gaiellaceae bacterium]
MTSRDRKLSRNETAFRAFNEGVRDVEERIGDSSVAEFVCECSDAGCEERIRLPLAEYEQVRADPIRFVIKKGHEVAALEHVVRETAEYAVVEKHEGEAAAVARDGAS